MKMRRQLVSFLAAIAIVAPAAPGQQVVDRIVATVNGQPVLQSDCELQRRYEAFLDQQPLTGESQPAVLERMIDQQLLRQQMKQKDLSLSAAEVEAKVSEVRRATPGASTADGWRLALAHYGLSEAEVRDRLEVQLAVLRFVDQRLRPSVHVDSKAVEAYYRDSFLPQLRERGAAEVPLPAVESRIEDILAQRAMDQALATWLQELRRQASVRLIPAATVATGAQASAGNVQ